MIWMLTASKGYDNNFSIDMAFESISRGNFLSWDWEC